MFVKIKQTTKLPVLITIPGNVPHYVHNNGEIDLIFHYYFPLIKSVVNMKYFYPNQNGVEIYGRTDSGSTFYESQFLIFQKAQQ